MAWYFRLTDNEAVRHDQGLDRRRLMDPNRAAAPETPTAQSSIRRAETHSRPGGADGHPVRAPQRHSVEHAATRDGLWRGHDLLAAPGALATGGRLEAPARGPARRIALP